MFSVTYFPDCWIKTTIQQYWRVNNIMIQIRNDSGNINQYLIAFALSLGAFLIVSEAWRYDLSTPYFYYNDVLSVSLFIKSIIDTGWFLTNPYVGVPNGYNFIDYPLAEHFHMLIFKLFALFSANYAVILNVFYVLTFPSVALTALFALKRLGLSFPLALTASILFTLLPYHFEHGQAHLFLSSYYIVPLMVWLSVSVVMEENQAVSPKRRFIKWGSLFLVCMLAGSSGVYYAFFGIFYLLASGVITSFTKQQWAPIRKAVLLVAIITFSGALNILPNYLKNPPPHHIKRSAVESEIYSFKIMSLLLPQSHHRVRALAKVSKKYIARSPANGGMTGALGIAGDIGFLILLGAILLNRNSVASIGSQAEKFYQIAKLNLCGILFATLGGFGTLFAYIVTPMIRCYDRMSIYIAFFSLYAFFYVLQGMLNKSAVLSRQKMVWLISLIILCIGVLDETTSRSITNWTSLPFMKIIQTTEKADKDFVQQIENIMPKNSAIFQLPYISFPEVDYDHLKAYLHSHHLRWSFGAMSTNKVSKWQKNVSRLPAREMLNALVNSGFSGIYIDRSKYTADYGHDIETQISGLIKTAPLVSSDGRLSFFDLRGYRS